MPYKEDFRRHSKRRKRGHDYHAPWKYHITIAKDPAAPLFSELVIRERNPDGVSVKLSELGEVVDNEIREFELHHPEIRVMEHIVMPDHVHALIHVKRRLAKPARHDFDQCVAGNLLLLSPVVYASMPRREHPSRQQCLEMNRLADLLATGNLTIQ